MTHTPLEKSFLLLQKAQQIHDEKSHRDILNLNLKDRLKHMALHFCKYVGNLRVSITVDVGNVVIFLFPKLLEDISLAYLSCS